MNIVQKTFVSLRKDGPVRTLRKILGYLSVQAEIRETQRIKKRILRHEDLEGRFTEIYRLNSWGSGESASGPGSSLAETKNLRERLPEVVENLSIKTIFDAPCGDFNWMKHVIHRLKVEYIGGDIVAPIIEENRRVFGAGNIQFIHIDLVRDSFPQVDLVICRDCLFHLSYADALQVLHNFCKSGSSYLLTTTHLNANEFVNVDIATGDFKDIDLFLPPYNFPEEALYRIPDGRKAMCLWTRSQVAAALT